MSFESNSELKAKLLTSSAINDLTDDPLEYKIIQYGYVTKQGKTLLRKNWKKRFALLLCAKIKIGAGHGGNYNKEEKSDIMFNTNAFIHQFKLLYFEDDSLSQLKGVVSFTSNDTIGLVAPRSSLSMSKISESIIMSKCLSTPSILNDSAALDNSMSFAPKINTSSQPENAKFYQLMIKNLETNRSIGLGNLWSSFPNCNGFYIMDQVNKKIWLFDTQDFNSAKNWLKAIWNVEKYYFSSSKKAKKYKGFSGFVSCELEQNVCQVKKANTLKYMIVVPNKYHIKFKGILMFDCIQNKKRIYGPSFNNNSLEKIRMKKHFSFIDDDDDDDGSYFQLNGDINKYFCNVHNEKNKMCWSVAITQYQKKYG